MSALLYGLAGGLVGAAQSSLLRRAAHAAPTPFGMLARLLAVGGVLLAAALAGHLLEAVAAWAGAFALSTFLIARRWS